MTSHPASATSGNILAGLNPLLSTLGLESADTYGKVEDAVRDYATTRGLHAWLHALTDGRLTVGADPASATLLRMDIPALTAAVNTAAPKAVTSVRVRAIAETGTGTWLR